MDRCPKCKRTTTRCQVNLFLDIPTALMHGLSKQVLRRHEVRVLGAGWPSSTIYCTNPKCGWVLRLGGSHGDDQEQ